MPYHKLLEMFLIFLPVVEKYVKDLLQRRVGLIKLQDLMKHLLSNNSSKKLVLADGEQLLDTFKPDLFHKIKM